MTRPWMRLLIFSLIVCILTTFSLANESTHDVDDGRTDRGDGQSPHTESWQEVAQEEQYAQDIPLPQSQEAVVEALQILGKTESATVSKLARFVRKPRGIIGNTFYYAKAIFSLLFLNAPTHTDKTSSQSTDRSFKLSQPLTNAVKLLESAALEDNADAIFLLAEMNFYGNYSHPNDYDEAFRRYRQLADLDGNSTAQYMVGFIYATGLSPANPEDQAMSMLYHTFAAEGGNTRSQMSLGYRNHAGIATPRNCDEAVHWYKKVADKAVAYYRSGPPGGHSLIRNAYRIADEIGGVYGEGASHSSAGPNARQGGPTSDAYADVEDVVEYLYLQALKGDLKANFGLAKLYYEGGRGLKRDFKTAKKYFMEVAREYWLSSGKEKKDASPGVQKLASKAAGYIGRMFLRGEGQEQSFSKAKTWFTRGLITSDALCQYSLGVMYMQGLGVDQNTVKAAEYFASAADQDLAVAQTNMGILFLDQGDVVTAATYFNLAARNSHIEAFYYLAEMNEQGIGRDRSCAMAATFYKIVVEKAETIWSSLNEATEAYENGDLDLALIGYLMAAEQGSENAQANVAWILDQSKPRWSPLTWLSSVQQSARTLIGNAALSLVHWTRSAKQNNADSMVKMGDYYLSGLGTVASAENAAACYQAAADSSQSAQAMWNLGWMHENGIGIEQDFHLAKRYYDQALETNHEAYLPVKLSLFKLRWRSWWNHITRGGVHGIEDDIESRKRLTFWEWFQEFLEADAAYYEAYEADDWEDHDGVAGAHGYDGTEDYLNGDDDDGLLETLMIGVLVTALVGLIWYRRQARAAQRLLQQQQQQQQQGQGQEQEGDGAENRAQQQQQQQQARDNGFFPEPGHPAWQAWMAGAVGP